MVTDPPYHKVVAKTADTANFRLLDIWSRHIIGIGMQKSSTSRIVPSKL